MSNPYVIPRQTAVKLLGLVEKGGYGARLVLTRYTSAYNAAEGVAVQTPTTYEGSGMRVKFKMQDIDGTRVLATDSKMLMSPITLTGEDMPKPIDGDEITFGGQKYRVVSVGDWNYAGTQVGFSAQVRQ